MGNYTLVVSPEDYDYIRANTTYVTELASALGISTPAKIVYTVHIAEDLSAPKAAVKREPFYRQIERRGRPKRW